MRMSYFVKAGKKLVLSFLYRRRDRAHREIKNIFYKVTQKRRSSGEKVDDMLQTLIDATYKYDLSGTDASINTYGTSIYASPQD